LACFVAGDRPSGGLHLLEIQVDPGWHFGSVRITKHIAQRFDDCFLLRYADFVRITAFGVYTKLRRLEDSAPAKHQRAQGEHPRGPTKRRGRA
jgi:hypothetical protein